MTIRGDMHCDQNEGWGGQLVAYLYDDLEPSERAEVEAHVSGCPACRRELAALGDVRGALAQWTPPEPAFGVAVHRPAPTPPAHWLAALGDIPVWAQTAAALLCVGVAAGLANLDVRYDADGLAVRTGWSSAPAPVAEPAPETAGRPWQADLVALEQGLRAELMERGAGTVPDASAGADSGDLARLRTLIEESEQRQRRELALRLADLSREVEYRRRDDLQKIDRSLGMIQANLGVMQNTGVEVMRQRQMLNDLAVRVSSQR
jgi:hypothetical protein